MRQVEGGNLLQLYISYVEGDKGSGEGHMVRNAGAEGVVS